MRIFNFGFGVCTVMLALLLTVSAEAVEKKVVAEKDLSAQEVDAAFDQVFKIQKKLERMQAKVITEKAGGIFKKSKANEAYVYAQMPDKLLFIDKGNEGENVPPAQYAIILIDGVFLWDIKPADSKGVREAERIDMNSAGSRDINIAALLIGADVATGKQLRDYYDISGKLEKFSDGTKSYHFVLDTIDSKHKSKRKELVDMWIEVGGVIPWKIKTVRMVSKVNPLNPSAPAKTSKAVSVKYITDLQTNLSKSPLQKFASDTFYFGRLMQENPGIKVIDGKGFEIKKEELQKDLAAVRKRL